MKSFIVAQMLFASPALAAGIGEDGLHKQDWFAVTFKDVEEDLETANDEGKRLASHQIEDLRAEPFHCEVDPMMDGVADRWSQAELRGIVVYS